MAIFLSCFCTVVAAFSLYKLMRNEFYDEVDGKTRLKWHVIASLASVMSATTFMVFPVVADDPISAFDIFRVGVAILMVVVVWLAYRSGIYNDDNP